LKKRKYNKEEVEIQAIESMNQGYMTEFLGRFTMDRSIEIAKHSFYTRGDEELLQSLVDEAVMRVCEKFLHYYKPGKSAANLIISMVYSAMYNKITSLKWSDVYGHRIKGPVSVIEDGSRKIRYEKYIKDDNISKDL
jgi:hypothetical protein